MHRSRSPFIAFAVTATTGRLLNRGIERITRVVSEAVHLGHHDVHEHHIDVSPLREHPDGIPARLCGNDPHVVLLENGRQREDVPDVVVDNERLAPGERPIAVVDLLEDPALRLRHGADRTVQQKRGVIEEALGEATKVTAVLPDDDSRVA